MERKFRESLPENCPPTKAEIVDTLVHCYRLVDNIPPKDEDFDSQIIKQPDRDFICKCEAHSVSLWLDKYKCIEMRKYTIHKNQKLCKVSIQEDSGFILIEDSKHVHWWPFSDCNLIDMCEVENEVLL